MAEEKKTAKKAAGTGTGKKSAGAPREAKEPKEKASRAGLHNASTTGSLVAIWQVLARYSSKDKPMTAADIARKLKRVDLPVGASVPSELTVERRMPKLVDVLSEVFPGLEVQVEGAGLKDAYVSRGQLRVVVENTAGESLAKSDVLAVVEVPAELLPSPHTIDNLLKSMSAMADEQAEDPGARQPPVRVRCVMASSTATGKTVYLPYKSIQETWTPDGGKEMPKDSDNTRARRYYLESVLTPMQWRMLTDMIKVYPYISADQTARMLQAIGRLNPGVNTAMDRYSFKKKNDALFKNLEILDRAIRQEQRVSITYGEYALNEADRPVLLQRRSAGQLAFSPYALMWSNGYYYLVGKQDWGMMNLRVDRILKVLPLPGEHFEIPADFDPVAYRDSSPVMYPGTPETIRLQCPAYLVSRIMDFFGEKARFRRLGDAAVEVELNVARGGTKLFLMQYADQVEVLAPPDLRREMREMLEKALAKYPADDPAEEKTE